MTKKELHELLNPYPDDMPIKFIRKPNDNKSKVEDFTKEDILHTSETAWFKEAEEDDEEDTFGLGDGQQYILFNPIQY